MSNCGCHVEQVTSAAERRVIRIALALNAAMFVVGVTAGMMARSSGLLADALDMLSDSFAYAIALVAIGRSVRFKRNAAFSSGLLLCLLGLAVLADTIRRAIGDEQPLGWVMIVSGGASLIVNTVVLRLLAPFRQGEVHLRASWIFTRADVIANIGVILAAMLVIATHSNVPDVIIGAAIGLYVVKEGMEILREARAEERLA